MLLLKRKDRKLRASADRWYRQYRRLLCCSDLCASFELAAGCVAVKKFRRSGADGPAGDLRARPPNRSCSVHVRAIRVFIA